MKKLAITQVMTDERLVVMFYDVEAGVLIPDLTDYTIDLGQYYSLSSKTILFAAYHLKRFWEFLSDRGYRIEQCSDAILMKFRDEEYKKTFQSKNGRNQKLMAQRSVNERLSRVYHWLAWLRIKGKVSPHLIGQVGCQVKSSLITEWNGPASDTGSLSWSNRKRGRQRCPLLFARTGKGSKHRVGYVPSEEARLAAISYLHGSVNSDYLAHRNSLIIDLANHVGFRRGSINSLTINAFRVALSDVGENGFHYIRPPSQKFNYADRYDIPAWLIHRVLHFVDNYLVPEANARGWNINLKNANLFLSHRNGQPLKDRSITDIVSAAMRAVGAPRGASLHVFRKKFASDDAEKEAHYRAENNLDTSFNSVISSTGLRLGHKSSESIAAYIQHRLSKARFTSEHPMQKHVADLEDQVLELKKGKDRDQQQIAMLEKLLLELSSSKTSSLEAAKKK